MSRFYIRPNSVTGEKINVEGPEAHHILDVMRLKEGDEITAFDGTGREYFGRIGSIRKKSLVIIVDRVDRQRDVNSCSVTLAQSVPKMDKMDYIIQKATELNVASIIPMETKRTVVKMGKDKFLAKQKRWERIVLEAAKQCGRASMPTIEPCLVFEDVLQRAGSYDLSLMPSLLRVKTRRGLKECISDFKGKSILVLIGPEGGFDPSEVNAALDKKVVPVSLGKNTLRCDTAAIAAIAIINHSLDCI